MLLFQSLFCNSVFNPEVETNLWNGADLKPEVETIEWNGADLKPEVETIEWNGADLKPARAPHWKLFNLKC